MKVHKLRTGIWLVLISLLAGIVTSWFIAGYLQRDLMFSAVLAAVVAAGVFILLRASALFSRGDAFSALSAVLLLMPLHTILDNVVNMLVDSDLVRLAFSSWKELALLGILSVVVLRRIAIRRVTLSSPLALVLASFFALWGAAFIFTADSLRIGLLEYRNIYEGLLVLLVLFAIRPPLARVFKLLDWMVAQGALLSIWAFVSRYLLSFHSYLSSFGYITPDVTPGTLQYRSVFSVGYAYFIRANSVFIGPNEFALYLATLIVPVMGILLFKRDQLSPSQRFWYISALLLMAGGELIAVSRSAWILIAVALVVMVFHMESTRRRIQVLLIAGMLLLVALAAVPNLRQYLMHTVRLEDPSVQGRVTFFGEGVATIVTNPLGIGLGNAGYAFFDRTARHVHTESYLFVIALELGWMGLVLYLLMIAAFAHKCYRLTNSRYPFERRLSALVGMALLVGTLASQFTSAISLDWLFQIYFWFFVGVAVLGTTPELSREAIPQALG